jgi:predicted nucleic acid-binding protein
LSGWLLDTNVVFEITRRNGDAPVLSWAAGRPEQQLYVSVLTLGEHDKAIHSPAHGLSPPPQDRGRSERVRGRFARRILSVSDPVVRRRGRISGEIPLATGRAPEVIDPARRDRDRARPGAGHTQPQARPDETAKAFRDGWFWSGDIAMQHPNGYVEIRDRARRRVANGRGCGFALEATMSG